MQKLVNTLPAGIAIEICQILNYTIFINDGEITVEKGRSEQLERLHGK